MTSRAELEAHIWRVSAPGTPRKPGAVLAARLTNAQAQEMADQLKPTTFRTDKWQPKGTQ